jgi:excisionase family DNA binding protein
MSTASASTVGSPLLNEGEAAAYLRVARSTFQRVIRPQLPIVRPTPGRVLFHRDDLDEYAERMRQSE